MGDDSESVRGDRGSVRVWGEIGGAGDSVRV